MNDRIQRFSEIVLEEIESEDGLLLVGWVGAIIEAAIAIAVENGPALVVYEDEEFKNELHRKANELLSPSKSL